MKRSILLAAVLALVSGAAAAHDYRIGSLEISNPWLRATPKGASVAGGYLKVTNKGTTPDRLVGGSVGFADKVEVHEMSLTGGVMKMRPLSGGLEIKPGQTVELKPGSYHLMFMKLKQPLTKGQQVKGTLEFEKAGKVDVGFSVEAIGGMPSPSHSGMSHGH